MLGAMQPVLLKLALSLSRLWQKLVKVIDCLKHDLTVVVNEPSCQSELQSFTTTQAVINPAGRIVYVVSCLRQAVICLTRGCTRINYMCYSLLFFSWICSLLHCALSCLYRFSKNHSNSNSSFSNHSYYWMYIDKKRYMNLLEFTGFSELICCTNGFYLHLSHYKCNMLNLITHNYNFFCLYWAYLSHYTALHHYSQWWRKKSVNSWSRCLNLLRQQWLQASEEFFSNVFF